MSRRSSLGPGYRRLFAASTISNLGDGIGIVAYPWLASAVTRNPLLIALVAVVQRLPWLVFTLPAGVITDRVERRGLMVRANAARAVLTFGVALVVLARSDQLPGPDAVADPTTVISTDLVLYLSILVATLLLGMAEVLYDNTAQTIMPSLVAPAHLERANGRLWSAEQIANTFAGPPLAALLLATAFSLPFFADALTFAVSAALISLLPRPASRPAAAAEPTAWRIRIGEGFRWLWSHDLLRPLAITLGLLNALGMMGMSILVLHGQEVLDTSPTEFAILSMGGAVGGVIGGWTASAVSRRIGTGPSLTLTLVGGAAVNVGVAFSSWWPAVFVLFAAFMFTAVLWNVITVSLRQTIIPDELLGRVNSVYRFFGWGMMPIGSLLGGGIVLAVQQLVTRDTALRSVWMAAGIGHLLVWLWAGPRLTTGKIEAARTEAIDPAVVEAPS